MAHFYILLQLIASLQKEVSLLETELNQANVQIATTTPIVIPNPPVNQYVPPTYNPPTSAVDSSPILRATVQQPVLASDPLCQNPANQSLADICNSTSTAMCGYQEPPSEGGHLLTMSCVAIQLCSLEHDCP